MLACLRCLRRWVGVSPDRWAPARGASHLGVVEAASAVGSRGEHGVAAELGDVLFSAVNLARHLGLDAEAIARESAQRFEARFRHVEQEGGDLAKLDPKALDRLWEAAKRAD